MDGAYTFTCQSCRARLTLVGPVEAAPGTDTTWNGARGLPGRLQASVFDNANVDESFILLDGKRQGAAVAAQPGGGGGSSQAAAATQASVPGHGQGAAAALAPAAAAQLPPPGQPQLTPQQQRGLEESFVMLGAASVLRPGPAGHAHLSPLHMQLLQQQQQQQQVLSQQRHGPSPQQLQSSPQGPGQTGGPGSPGIPAQGPVPAQVQPGVAQGGGPGSALQPALQASPTQPLPQSGSGRAGAGGGGGGAGPAAAAGGPTGGGPGAAAAGAGAAGGGGGGAAGPDDGGGGSAGSGLDSKLQALAQLFELASTNTQVDHPLCMDCVGQLKEEMEAQIAEAEREIAAYTACLAQLEGGGAAGLTGSAACSSSGSGRAGGGGSAGGDGAADSVASGNVGSSGAGPGAGPGAGAGTGAAPEEEYYVLEEISRLEQERDQERARAEVLETELAAVGSELASLAAASADLDSLEERYWHDVADFELLLRAHTDERGALLAKIDRAGQRLQLLKNTSVLYDAFKIWHDGPFGTISGFRLGRTPEVPVEWDEVNAAWGQAVLLLHTMAQMVKLQFSGYRLLPMGSHPRVADKRSTYDLFGPVSKLWSANYDRAMTAYLACLKEFGEFARRKDIQDGKATPFNFPFSIDGDKVNNATIKLTLNKDARWTKALKFMLANLKIALQWTVKQDQAGDAPPLPHLAQEGPQLVPER